MLASARLALASADFLLSFVAAAAAVSGSARGPSPEDAHGCWDAKFTQERCCSVPGGPHGDPLCWIPPFTHRRESCCDKDNILMKQSLVRANLLSHLGFPNASSLLSSEAWDDGLLGRAIAYDLPMTWAGNLSRAGAVTTAASLLRALRPEAAAGIVRRAYAMFLAVERPLQDHFGSGWPVFALLHLLVFLRRGEDAFADVREADDTGGACAACVSRAAEAGREACIAACAAAALRLPAGLELKGTGAESQEAVAAYRGLLLQYSEAEMRGLGTRGLFDLGRRGVWARLHELQQKVHHRGACPEDSVLFQTNAEPAHPVCLPLLARARDWGSKHLLEILLKSGRWRDCDPLLPLAVTSNVAATPEAAAVDVGFAFGACTSYLLAMGIRVHAVDPFAGSLALLRGAAWEAEAAGRLEVHFAAASDLERPGTSTAVAPTVRLDRLLGAEPGPLLLKIDVEGDEQAVLRGAARLFEKRLVRALTLELHRKLLQDLGTDPWEPLELLIRAGFEVEVLPWYPEPEEAKSDYKVSSAERFRELAARLEARGEGYNMQVVATLPRSLWPAAR